MCDNYVGPLEFQIINWGESNLDRFCHNCFCERKEQPYRGARHQPARFRHLWNDEDAYHQVSLFELGPPERVSYM